MNSNLYLMESGYLATNYFVFWIHKFQNALKSRYDVPRDWPELLPALLTGIQSEDSVSQHRALLLLHHTVKALSTKRLVVDRKVFHDLIEELLPYLLQIWTVHHGHVVQVRSFFVGCTIGDPSDCRWVNTKDIWSVVVNWLVDNRSANCLWKFFIRTVLLDEALVSVLVLSLM